MVQISLFGKIQQIQKKKKNDWYLGPADIKLKRNEVGNIKTNHDNMPVQFLNVERLISLYY